MNSLSIVIALKLIRNMYIVHEVIVEINEVEYC